METGFRGAFVIPWSQTKVDGLGSAPVDTLEVGATWAWRGEALRVDGPSGILRLEMTNGGVSRRRCAARLVRRLVSMARHDGKHLGKHLSETEPAGREDERPLADTGFVVTDGRRTYTVTAVPAGGAAPPLLVFVDDMPPRGRELWVVHHSLDRLAHDPAGPKAGGVICFTPGTLIETPGGPCLVEALREGDHVCTKDDGAQPILWKAHRRMTGARLFAMPHLRPVCIRTGAFGIGQPDRELLVSPEHRMLVKGQVARSLFNTPEVLVTARDLVNGETVRVDLGLREVTYIHLLLPRHEVLWANGVETESFHPASAALSTLDAQARARLLAINPVVEQEPHAYGGFARRSLRPSEAAILRHEAA